MSELSVRTGIPVSTIHHYRQRGLLPPPVPAGGHRLRYDDQHVRALRLIRRLREQRNLSLQRIAEILPHLLASEQEAFRPAMWDRLLTARASADPTLAAIVDVDDLRAEHPLVGRGHRRRRLPRCRHRQGHVLPILRLQGIGVHRRRPHGRGSRGWGRGRDGGRNSGAAGAAYRARSRAAAGARTGNERSREASSRSSPPRPPSSVASWRHSTPYAMIPIAA